MKLEEKKAQKEAFHKCKINDDEKINFLKNASQIDIKNRHRLYDLFKLHEIVGYIDGMICAYNHRNSLPKAPALWYDVCLNQMPAILTWYEQEIPSVVAFIDDHREVLDKILHDSRMLHVRNDFPELCEKLKWKTNRIITLESIKKKWSQKVLSHIS